MTGKIPKVAIHIATFADTGFFPWAPGTLASALTLPLVYFLQPHPAAYLAVLALVLLLGTWSSGLAEQALGKKDPGSVVIDEVAGMMLAAFALPKDWLWLFPAFVLFRLLDIWKPWPIRRLQNLPGGWGIMADDVAAGLLANVILRIIAISNVL